MKYEKRLKVMASRSCAAPVLSKSTEREERSGMAWGAAPRENNKSPSQDANRPCNKSCPWPTVITWRGSLAQEEEDEEEENGKKKVQKENQQRKKRYGKRGMEENDEERWEWRSLLRENHSCSDKYNRDRKVKSTPPTNYQYHHHHLTTMTEPS